MAEPPTPDEARAAIEAAVARLTASGARTEVLAEIRARRLGPIRRPDAVVPVGRVWRLGVLLLDPAGALRRTGDVIQAQPLRFDNHQSNRAAARRELREAIERSGIAPGETVNLGAVPVDLDDVLEISWDRSGDPGTLVPLPAYLRDRVGLLANPATGA